MNRFIVCGSRTWKDEQAVKETICSLVTHHGDVTIVHGGCPTGADSFASKHARSRGAKEEPYYANWNKYGNSAGPIRNEHMAKLGAVECIAFWDGESRGTLDMIRAAVRNGIRVRILPP